MRSYIHANHPVVERGDRNRARQCVFRSKVLLEYTYSVASSAIGVCDGVVSEVVEELLAPLHLLVFVSVIVVFVDCLCSAVGTVTYQLKRPSVVQMISDSGLANGVWAFTIFTFVCVTLPVRVASVPFTRAPLTSSRRLQSVVDIGLDAPVTNAPVSGCD